MFMFNKNEINTKKFVIANRNLFESIASGYSNMRDEDDVIYSILNYEKILKEMKDFLNGYVEYKESGDDKYAGKVMSSAINFYNGMFETDKYRRTMTLSDMRSINKSFLELSKLLQDKMIEISESYDDSETVGMLKLTDNQYAKVSKVYRDDMDIYLWITSKNSIVKPHVIPVDLRVKFLDKTTPVIHRDDRS